MFSSGLILGGHECLCATSQKHLLTRVILFAVNYCSYAHGDVSIRFNGKDDNVVLELSFYSVEHICDVERVGSNLILIFLLSKHNRYYLDLRHRFIVIHMNEMNAFDEKIGTGVSFIF